MRTPLVNRTPTMTKINVTPIIDVALVLVIILLITAPMLSVADLEVELPSAHSRDVEDQGFISITLSHSGEIAVDEQVLAGIGQIRSALRTRIAEQESDKAMVVVRADSGLPHSLIRQVLDEARRGGAKQLGIATRQKGGGSS
ncbi:MAG: biopolymer transporter ExbD [Candidatus Krumholzibacteriota bacterium]